MPMIAAPIAPSREPMNAFCVVKAVRESPIVACNSGWETCNKRRTAPTTLPSLPRARSAITPMGRPSLPLAVPPKALVTGR